MRPPLIATSDVAKISISEDPLVVQVSLTDDGAKKFTTATTGMKGKRLAVIVQGRIVSAPLLQDAPLGRSFEFSFRAFHRAATPRDFNQPGHPIPFVAADAVAEQVTNWIEQLRLIADFLPKLIRIVVKRTATQVGYLLLSLIAWKRISTDW